MSDSISRQKAIDATWEEPTYTDPINVLTEVRDRIKKLPSVEPERKTGRWKEWEYERWGATYYQCSECGFEPSKKTRFCPNCGARMQV